MSVSTSSSLYGIRLSGSQVCIDDSYGRDLGVLYQRGGAEWPNAIPTIIRMRKGMSPDILFTWDTGADNPGWIPNPEVRLTSDENAAIQRVMSGKTHIYAVGYEVDGQIAFHDGPNPDLKLLYDRNGNIDPQGGPAKLVRLGVGNDRHELLFSWYEGAGTPMWVHYPKTTLTEREKLMLAGTWRPGQADSPRDLQEAEVRAGLARLAELPAGNNVGILARKALTLIDELKADLTRAQAAVRQLGGDSEDTPIPY